jgi:bacterioferritin-associated ferredoxin
MIVCLCFDVSDRLVRERARQGRSLGEVLEETGAGSSCGACRLAIARIHAGERVDTVPCARGAAARDAA